MIPDSLRTLFDLLIVVAGFGAIVFIHELGHFLAARWAGIRVLAFALGFGPAVVSYRKGLGFRRGSSEREYEALRKREREGIADPEDPAPGAVSPTEYRFNALPLGGYVKMLGQEDLNPEATSGAPDSYQNRPVWKRMVVISAGVVANLITAAVLFVVVFLVGLKTEPPVIGEVEPGSPAARAVALEPEGTPDGLAPGDRVLRINGERAHDFSDVFVGVAMSKPGTASELLVEREGSTDAIRFRVEPERSDATGLLAIGVYPAKTLRLDEPTRPGARARRTAELEQIGLVGVEPGMTLISAGGRTDLHGPAQIDDVFADSGGETVELVFRADDGREVTVEIEPQPELQTGWVTDQDGAAIGVRHILGLTPVMTVAEQGNTAQGLEHGDVFLRIGDIEYPGVAQGIRQVRASERQTLPLVVERTNRDAPVTIDAEVDSNGQIGFNIGTTADRSALLAMPEPRLATDPETTGDPTLVPAATRIIDRPGMRVVAVDGEMVSDFASLRAALRDATGKAHETGDGASVTLSLALPMERDGEHPVIEREWTLSPDDVRSLHELSWEAPYAYEAAFAELRVVDRAEGPVGAIGRGLGKTKRVMQQTYLTIARLVQGGVQVQHLRGPVGIAHMGTTIAERGPVWLLFFMALISVNLAVLNFLPLPIVDGGQFLMLVYEQLRGKPVPIPVQNVITLAGLVLIGSLFLVVTFHDIARLVGG